MDKPKTVFASGGGVVTNRKITNVNAASLNSEINTVVHGGPSGNVGQVPQADYTACDGGVICADQISGVNVGGDINLSVTTTFVHAANPGAASPPQNSSSTKRPVAKMITEQKVKLIECLMADHSFILQHAHAKGIVTDSEYLDLKHTPQPVKTVTDLIDRVIFKGEVSCSRFIEVLKEPEVVETFLQLREITKNW